MHRLQSQHPNRQMQCNQILSMETKALSKAFQTDVSGIPDKVLACCYECYKKIFLKWALVIYPNYPRDFLSGICEMAFSDCLLKFKEHAEQDRLYTSNASIKTVVFAYFKNCLRDHLQKEKRFSEKQKLYNSQAGILDGEEKNEITEQQLVKLENALVKMDVEDRQIIIWRHVEMKTNEEIANFLSITTASATNRIYRCMQRLRQLTDRL